VLWCGRNAPPAMVLQPTVRCAGRAFRCIGVAGAEANL